MSQADDRRAAEAERERDQDAASKARPVEVAESVTDPRSWSSYCAGWRMGVHEKLRIEADGSWRCRWCCQVFAPPTAADRAKTHERAVEYVSRQRAPWRRGRSGQE